VKRDYSVVLVSVIGAERQGLVYLTPVFPIAKGLIQHSLQSLDDLARSQITLAEIFRDTGQGLVAAVAFTIVSCEVARQDRESLDPKELNSSFTVAILRQAGLAG